MLSDGEALKNENHVQKLYQNCLAKPNQEQRLLDN
jgi:hypothetical protein